jgi:pyruvyl transferase EpsO
METIPFFRRLILVVAKQNTPMDMLKARLSEITAVIPPGSNIVYLDYPVHGNIGDLLILKGTEKFFSDYNIHVSARYSYFNFPDHLAIPKDHIIVCHGGGNFGDIYGPHQALRERVVSQYPQHRIVILPQTVYFQNKENQERAKSIFSKHQDLHIFVRDSWSLYRVAGFSRHLRVMPDMAHQLWPISPVKAKRKASTLYLLRRDVEKKERLHPAVKEHVVDWKNLLSKDDLQAIQGMIQQQKNSTGAQDSAALAQKWYKITDQLIQKAITAFSRYDEITTSRMHGHILACLMNKKNYLIDNSYGKNSTYYKTWTYRVKEASIKAVK